MKNITILEICHTQNNTLLRQFDLSHHKLQVLPVLFPPAVNSTIKVSVVLFWFPGSCCAISFSLPCSHSFFFF